MEVVGVRDSGNVVLKRFDRAERRVVWMCRKGR